MNWNRFTLAVYTASVYACVSMSVNLKPTHLRNKFYSFYSVIIKTKGLISVYYIMFI